MRCANCETHVAITQDGAQKGALVVRDGDRAVAAVCRGCTDGALVVKITFRRNHADGEFTYDQYTALEMETKGIIGRR